MMNELSTHHHQQTNKQMIHTVIPGYTNKHLPEHYGIENPEVAAVMSMSS